MPEPLRSEDTDLTRLIARIQQQHGGAARIVYHDTVRKGGVLGFFTQELHRVAYLVDEPAGAAAEVSAGHATPSSIEPAPAWQSVDELLDQADAADGPAAGIALGTEQVDEFAQILRETFNSAPASTEETATPSAVAAFDPLPDLRPVNLASVTRIGGGRESSVFQTVEDALSELPPSPDAPSRAGEVLALVGPLTAALSTATSLTNRLHLPPSNVRFAGLATHPVGQLMTTGTPPSVDTPAEARRLRNELCSSPTPSVVVIPTDATEQCGRDPWVHDIVAGLAPTAVWVLVDATTKAEDNHRLLSELPAADALVIHSMQATVNPQTVRELGVPIALIDGRKPDSYAASSMLLGALRSVSAGRDSMTGHAVRQAR